MLISRNFERQGAPSEEDEAVVTYGDSDKSRSNAVFRNLYNQQVLIRRNFEGQGKASAKPEVVVTYAEGDKSML